MRGASEILDHLSPFHTVIDDDGLILRAGPALVEVLGASPNGLPFRDVFEVRRPTLDGSPLLEQRGQLMIARLRGTTIEVRGQLELFESVGLVFVATPWIAPGLARSEVELPLHLLPPHDPSADWFMLTQAMLQQQADLERLVVLLQEREEKLRAVVHNIAEGLLVVTPEGAIESSNAAARTMFQTPVDHARIESLFQGGLDRPLLEHARGRTRELVGLRPDGVFPVAVSGSLVSTAAGERTVLLVRDLTEDKKLDVLKRHFIAVVAHELRTPLAAIRAPLGLVASGALGELEREPRELLELAERNAVRLGRLIDDLLDVERLQAGHLRFVEEMVQLDEVVASAVESVTPLARERRLEVVCVTEPLRYSTDATRIHQVVVNLLANAVRFSPDGGRIDVSLEADGGGARLLVVDRGPGIPEHMRKSIFDLFVQVEGGGQPDGSGRAGSGIGLTVARAIIERLGGEIRVGNRVEGVPTSGSTFSVHLPAKES